MREVINNIRLVRRRPAFGRFWFGIMVSRSGDALTTVALSWLVLSIATSRELGLVLLCFGLPRILSGTVAGRMLDRFQPRILLGFDNAIRCVLVALIPLLDHLELLRIGHLYVIAAMSALLSTFTGVAEGAVVPKLVQNRELEGANSLLSINWDIAYIVAPALGGLAIKQLGPSAVLVFDAATFALMSLICFGLPRIETRPTESRNWFADFIRGGFGFRSLNRFPGVLMLTTLTLLFLFLNGMLEVLYPVFSKAKFGSDARIFGLLVAAAALGSFFGVLAGYLMYRKLPAQRRIGLVMLSGAPFFVLLAAVDNAIACLVVVAVASFMWGPYFVLERSLVQRLVPDGARGEVSGARMAFSSLGFPLGSAIAGLLLANFAVTTVVVMMAVSFVVLAAAALTSRPLHEAGVVEARTLEDAQLASEAA